MDAARLLAAIIAQGGPVSSLAFGSHASLRALVGAGFLGECGVVQSILCDDCAHPHDAPLVFEDDQYAIYCPELGFVVKQRSEVTALVPNYRRFVQNLATVLGCTQTKSTPIHRQTWRVGVMAGLAADVAVYLHPILRDEQDLLALQDALAREPKARLGVVITASGTLSLPPFETILMEDCIRFDAGDGSFVVAADLGEIAGVPSKRKGGRPSVYQPYLAELVARRKADGVALPGLNEETRAIQEIFRSKFPNDPTPSISTIKRAIADG